MTPDRHRSWRRLVGMCIQNATFAKPTETHEGATLTLFAQLL
jgi:hypothetical protein